MTKIDFTTATGPQLVAAYNEMVLTAIDLGITTAQPVKRFSGVDAGRTRCEKLQRLIEDAAGDKDLPNTGVGAKPETGSGVTAEAAPESSDVTDVSTNADLPGEESDDMAKKRKAAKAKTKTKKAGKPRGDGPSLASYTEEWNALVPQAKKLEIKGVKLHTSHFETKDKGKAAVARLTKLIAAAKK